MNPDGSIAGIPESWKKRLQLMMSTEEAENPENAEKAQQIFTWIDTREGSSQDFMRVNSSPGNSAVLSSNSSHTSDEGFQSISDSIEDSDTTVDESSEPKHEAEIPTLRRKKNTRQGPRVTRNLSDDAVLAQLQDICEGRLPWENYDKVGYKDNPVILVRIRIHLKHKTIFIFFKSSNFFTLITWPYLLCF